MLDDLDRLRTNLRLLELLSHYAILGAENRETWQNRLMELEGVEPKELTKLHGELIAFSWIDQNTGDVPCCYRITLAGLRAKHQVEGAEITEELAEIPEKTTPRVQRKKKEKSESVAMVTSEQIPS